LESPRQCAQHGLILRGLNVLDGAGGGTVAKPQGVAARRSRRVWERKFLGFRLNRQQQIEVAPEGLERFKARVRELRTVRTGRGAWFLAAPTTMHAGLSNGVLRRYGFLMPADLAART